MTRYLEQALRRWWLWLLPLVLPAVVVGGLYAVRTPQYDVSVTIWAERALYLSVPGDNPWVTPAQMQVNLLSELLRTRAFLVRVAKDTPLQAYTTSESGRDFLEEYFARRLWVSARGSQVIDITFRTAQPELGIAVLNSLIAAYTEHVTLSGQEQARTAMEFYQGLLPEREQEFVKSSDALRNFLLSLPPRPTDDQATAERVLERAQLVELQRREDLARRRYEDTLSTLERIQLQENARETAQARGFRIIDPPVAPTQPISIRREFIMPLAATAAVGLGLPVLVTILTTWLDASLRSRRDVQHRLGLMTLGGLPRYRAQRRAGQAAQIRSLTLAPGAGDWRAGRPAERVGVAVGDD